jgi:hypothetical protein
MKCNVICIIVLLVTDYLVNPIVVTIHYCLTVAVNHKNDCLTLSLASLRPCLVGPLWHNFHITSKPTKLIPKRRLLEVLFYIDANLILFVRYKNDNFSCTSTTIFWEIAILALYDKFELNWMYNKRSPRTEFSFFIIYQENFGLYRTYVNIWN